MSTYWITIARRVTSCSCKPRTVSASRRVFIFRASLGRYNRDSHQLSSALPLPAHVTPLIGLSMVTINVIDSNDHPPVFSKTAYSASLPENLPAGHCFLHVSFHPLRTSISHGSNERCNFDRWKTSVERARHVGGNKAPGESRLFSCSALLTLPIMNNHSDATVRQMVSTTAYPVVSKSYCVVHTKPRARGIFPSFVCSLVDLNRCAICVTSIPVIQLPT